MNKVLVDLDVLSWKVSLCDTNRSLSEADCSYNPALLPTVPAIFPALTKKTHHSAKA